MSWFLQLSVALLVIQEELPPRCNSGIMGIQEGPNIITIIRYRHQYRVGGPPNR